MLFFKDFEKTDYRFGNEDFPIIFQNLTVYSDVVDQIKNNISFYNLLHINDGFRPDQMSIRLYGTPIYYWTFYLLNDKLRLQGWPLSGNELDVKIKKEFPNTTVTTKESIATKFKVGRTLAGSESGASGKILHRNLDLGQITVEGVHTFKINPNPEAITNTFPSAGGTTTETVTISNFSEEYNAAHHYEDASGKTVDIDPAVGPGAQLTEVTNYDYYYNQNEALRDIKVIRPEHIVELVASYKRSVRG